jgi:hypothetical protein
MTNAKNIIVKKAEELIDYLVQKEESRFNDIKESYELFLKENPSVYQYGPYDRKKYYSLSKNGESDYTNVRYFYHNRGAVKLLEEVRMATDTKGIVKYLENYRELNKVKLVRAIEKYITEDMTVKGEVYINEGVKGVEVSAEVNTTEGLRNFRTNAIFAGGYIQRYHYRYRGGLHLVK